MHTGYRYVSSLFLAAALLAPPGIMAAFTPQDQERHEEHQREEQRRYYDDGNDPPNRLSQVVVKKLRPDVKRRDKARDSQDNQCGPKPLHDGPQAHVERPFCF